MKKIFLPHLNYTVYVRQAKEPPKGAPGALAWVSNDDRNTCTVHMNLNKKISPGDLAHELVHVLQFIALNRNIDFVLEQEHFGYMMHYLMGQILGYEFEN